MDRPHRDRSTRLTLLGVVALLVGAVWLMLAGFSLLLPLIARTMPGVHADPRTAAVGALTYGIVGGSFLLAGIGSIRRRRWVRSVMLVLGWTWLITGVLVSAVVAIAFPSIAGIASAQGSVLPDGWVPALRLLAVGVSLLFGVALPAVFVVVYRDPDLDATCRAANPGPGWTDGKPPAVLGLSLAMGLAGAISLPMVFQPVVPLFGRLVTGGPAALLTLLVAAACGWVARETYRERVSGWWGALLLLVGIGITTTWTMAAVPPEQWLQAMGYPDEQQGLMSDDMATAGAWLSGLLTVATVVYLARLRRHFDRGPAGGR